MRPKCFGIHTARPVSKQVWVLSGAGKKCPFPSQIGISAPALLCKKTFLYNFLHEINQQDHALKTYKITIKITNLVANEKKRNYKFTFFANSIYHQFNPNLGVGGGRVFGNFTPPSWFSRNNSKTVKAVTLKFCSIQ